MTTDTKAPSLKPCPFCGGCNIEAVDSLDFVSCQNCGASLEDSEPSARELWNTRATQSETENEVPALHNRGVVSNPVRAGSNGRTDGGSGDASTGDSASGCLAAVRDDGNSAGRAGDTGLSATPPAPTPSAGRERIARLWHKAHNDWIRASRHGTQEEADSAAVTILTTALLPDAAAIRADERERCAKIAEERVDGWDNLTNKPKQVLRWYPDGEAIAAAIRAAGEK